MIVDSGNNSGGGVRRRAVLYASDMGLAEVPVTAQYSRMREACARRGYEVVAECGGIFDRCDTPFEGRVGLAKALSMIVDGDADVLMALDFPFVTTDSVRCYELEKMLKRYDCTLETVFDGPKGEDDFTIVSQAGAFFVYDRLMRWVGRDRDAHPVESCLRCVRFARECPEGFIPVLGGPAMPFDVLKGDVEVGTDIVPMYGVTVKWTEAPLAEGQIQHFTGTMGVEESELGLDFVRTEEGTTLMVDPGTFYVSRFFVEDPDDDVVIRNVKECYNDIRFLIYSVLTDLGWDIFDRDPFADDEGGESDE